MYGLYENGKYIRTNAFINVYNKKIEINQYCTNYFDIYEFMTYEVVDIIKNDDEDIFTSLH